MKIPKSFTKMTLDQQEKYLSDKLRQNEQEYYSIKKLLGQVRGGMKLEPQTDERPDLEYDVQQLKKGEGV